MSATLVRYRRCRNCREPFTPRGPAHLCLDCDATKRERVRALAPARRLIDWDALPLGVETDRAIAERTGLSIQTVAQARGRRGIPPASAERRAAVLVDMRTPYADDVSAQLFVEAFPDGMALEEIGEAMGVTRERVRQIEEQALRNLGARLALAGVTREDFEALLARRDRG